jgi:hypothetical protein
MEENEVQYMMAHANKNSYLRTGSAIVSANGRMLKRRVPP